MVTRELDSQSPPGADPALDELARDLRAPLDAIVATLQRLALARAGDADPDNAAPDLLWRARHLADELTQVVGALAATPEAPIDARAPHTTVLVRRALTRAADTCAGALGARRVVVRCSPQLAATVQPDRFHDLLVATIEESATRRAANADVRVGAQRIGTRLVIEVDGGVAAGRGIERFHHLVRAVGGRIEVLSGPQARDALRIHIPQGRSDDLGELPDDVA
jgi:hypothetical protein